MTEAKSYVETTFPPGYRGEKYGQGWEWHTRAEGRAVFGTRAECCRSAWRHWTATVLREREMEWGSIKQDDRSIPQAYYEDRVRYVYTDDAGVMLRHRSDGETWFDVMLHVDEYVSRWAARYVKDPDEAMARFAGLVLATEGMVTR